MQVYQDQHRYHHRRSPDLWVTAYLVCTIVSGATSPVNRWDDIESSTNVKTRLVVGSKQTVTGLVDD